MNQRVLVVYNATVPDSLAVANYYISKRGIPAANKCGISPPATTYLAATDFDTTVKTPIKSCLTAVGPANILYIVFTYQTPYGRFGTDGNGYAVDQSIADIWDQYNPQIQNLSPGNPHPYFASAQTQGNVYQPFVSLADYRAQPGALTLYSVWRLDAATATLAQGMVDKAIAAETGGLMGQACFDRNRGDITSLFDWGYLSADWDIHQAGTFAAQAGYAVTEDPNDAEFGTAPAPLRCDNAALYSGWYSLNHYNDAFTWNTGAIGLHLDSASAVDPRGGTNWASNAIQKGITVTSGSVQEPYLEGLVHPDGAYRNLFEGANVGDAFLRNTAWLKWVILYLGDPLYRPFPSGLSAFNALTSPQSSLALNPQTVVGGTSATGTITLANAAPSGGATVNLTSSYPAVVPVPASVTVAQGSRTATFPIATNIVPATTYVEVTAAGAIARANTIALLPLLGQVSLAPTTISGSGTVLGAVHLNSPAPTAGVIVTLSSDTPAVAAVPATVSIAGGTVTAYFVVTVSSVSANTPVVVSAALGAATQTASMTVAPGPTNYPPTADSVKPASGSGPSQIFQVTYSDANGSSDLATVQFQVSTSTSGVNACWVSYYRPSNTLSLYRDAADNTSGSLTPGVAGTAQNSQCILDGGSSSVSTSGNSLTVNFALAFKPGFAGAKTTYAIATDNESLNTGLQSRGAWTVTVAPPTADSATPASGMGASQTFTLKYSSPNGFGALTDVYALINGPFNGAGACWIFYDSATRGFYLVNDAANTLIGPLMAGAPASLSNSQCAINGAGVAAAGSGNSLTVTLNVAFTGSFHGTQNIYMYAADTYGLSSGWQNRGSWTVPVVSAPPTADSVAPASGTGATQSFAFKYSTPNGASYLTELHVLINRSFNGTGACWAYYNRAANNLFLIGDLGNAVAGPLAPGDNASLKNGQCTLNGLGSSVVSAGNTITMTLNLAFASSFRGTQSIFLYDADSAGSNSGWQNRGVWTVPGAGTPPAAGTASPATGAGSSQSFTFTYSSASGFAYLTDAYVLFNGAFGTTGACWVFYDKAAAGFFLVNDSGTALAGPLIAGAAATIQNSQCVLNGSGSSVSGSGDTLSMTLNLSFNHSFAGLQTIFLYSADQSGQTSGWQNRGTWTVP